MYEDVASEYAGKVIRSIFVYRIEVFARDLKLRGNWTVSLACPQALL